MPRHVALALVSLSTIVMLAVATPAGAVVKGASSTQGSYTVRLVGSAYCSGVVIARRAVATAAHCGHGVRVMAGGRSYRVASSSRSAVLDDGRHVSVTGDAAILRLATPLPSNIDAASVGDGEGDTFTIAGYGTTDERWRGTFGALREAALIAAEPRALVDPNRTGSIGASACFGDSGGPVMRGGMLVGVITRAAHPHPRIACGHLTRWAPIVASDTAQAVAVAAEEGTRAVEPPERKHPRPAKRAPTSVATAPSLFSLWFAPKVEARRVSRHKEAQR
jgi:hypothetical protein